MQPWFGTLRQWHWISSAVCLVGLLLFAFTGITLNHAAQIEASPTVASKTAVLPEALQQQLIEQAPLQDLPESLRDWLEGELELTLAGREPEWSGEELYLALPRPGGDAWLTLDLSSGELEYEATDRGWISWLNDLHKGRNTGTAWSWFIDIFAGACMLFSLTGLLLLLRHAGGRPATWPLVTLGLVVPLVLAVLFIH